jgi:hypothetical protein
MARITAPSRGEGNGLHYTAYFDRAPDTNNGANYVVGGSC